METTTTSYDYFASDSGSDSHSDELPIFEIPNLNDKRFYITHKFYDAMDAENPKQLKILLKKYPAKYMIYFTIEMGHFELLKFYVRYDSNLKYGKFDNYFLLHCCAQYDRIVMAKWLIDRGADVNKSSAYGVTSLHTACFYSKLKMVKLLCAQSQTYLNQVDSFHRNAFNIACGNPENLDIVKFLCTTSIYKNVISTHGESPIGAARRNSAHSIVLYLVSVKDQFNIKID